MKLSFRNCAHADPACPSNVANAQHGVADAGTSLLAVLISLHIPRSSAFISMLILPWRIKCVHFTLYIYIYDKRQRTKETAMWMCHHTSHDHYKGVRDRESYWNWQNSGYRLLPFQPRLAQFLSTLGVFINNRWSRNDYLGFPHLYLGLS